MPFSLRFSKSARLLTPESFRAILRRGHEYKGEFLVFHVTCVSKKLESKLGMTVTRKFGKAHERNRFKRLTREVFRLKQKDWPINLHIHVRPNKSHKPLTFHMIEKDFKSLVSSYIPKNVESQVCDHQVHV